MLTEFMLLRRRIGAGPWNVKRSLLFLAALMVVLLLSCVALAAWEFRAFVVTVNSFAAEDAVLTRSFDVVYDEFPGSKRYRAIVVLVGQDELRVRALAAKTKLRAQHLQFEARSSEPFLIDHPSRNLEWTGQQFAVLVVISDLDMGHLYDIPLWFA